MSEHYFTAEPSSDIERRTLNLRLAGQPVAMQTAPGVFCPDRLDAGTAVLLSHAPTPPASGNFLDIGCGWGPISVSLGLLSPDARVYGVDVNNRALELARDNAAGAGAANVSVARPEKTADDLRFDLIWSNPPIRVGKQVLHDLMLTWLPRLVVGGRAYLVVQKNLGSDSLQAWLTQQLGAAYTVSRMTSVKGFRILQVVRESADGPAPLPLTASQDRTGQD